MTDGWVPEARPVPQALTDTYKAEPYKDPFLGSIMDRLDNASKEVLFALSRGGIGDPQ